MRLLSLFTAALALGTANTFPVADTQTRDVTPALHTLNGRDLAIRGPVRGSKGDKPDPVLAPKPKAPPKEKVLSDSEDEYRDTMKEQPGRPKLDYQIPTTSSVKKGQTGIQVKEKDGKTYVVLYYGDEMKYHASHQKYFDAVYKFLNGRGFSLRKHAKANDQPDNPTTRTETLRGLVEYIPTARDENPPLQWNYLKGSHTVMRVPQGESSFQGTMIQQAARLGGSKGIFMAVDNRSDATKDLVARLLRGPAAADGPAGYPAPKVAIPKIDENEMLSFTVPVPKEILPKHLQRRGLNTDNPADLVQFINYAPLYNLQVSGADQYTPEITIAKRAAMTESLAYRDIISSIESQQSDAGDASQVDEAQQVEMWLWAKSVAQANASVLLQPYIDAVMNGSSNPMAEAQAWNLYSIISPDVHVVSPFLGNYDMWDSIAQDYAGNATSKDAPVADFQQYVQTLGDFNAFVYSQAVAAVNATGLLQDLYTLDEWLSGANITNWPDGSWTVDDHETDAMMGYLEQMAAYNGFSWDGSNGTAQTAMPQWVLDNMNTTALLQAANVSSLTNSSMANNATRKAAARSVVRVA